MLHVFVKSYVKIYKYKYPIYLEESHHHFLQCSELLAGSGATRSHTLGL